jgi:hypothetical protein
MMQDILIGVKKDEIIPKHSYSTIRIGIGWLRLIGAG